MRYSLVLHANGPNSKDYNIYLTDVSGHNEEGNWFRVGMLQNVHFYATAENFIHKLQVDLVGLTINECDKPDLSKGVNIFYSDFIRIKEYKNQEFVIGNVYIKKNEQIMGFIKNIDFKVDAYSSASLYIEVYDAADWVNDVPEWIDLKVVSHGRNDT